MTLGRPRWGLILALLAVAAYLGWAYGGEPPYRRADWPHWRTVEVDGLRCSVRVHVLRRDALRKSFSDLPDVDTGEGDPCLLLGGLWLDRYTGQPIGDPQSLDVDHVIPLLWAHQHGAAGWPRDRKAAYANNLRYRWHLLAVSAAANRAKGGQGPESWLPPDPAIHCQYAEAWALIAVVWRLDIPETTRAALERLAATC